ncbi:O-antigen ligase family protein [Sulfurimonas sp.]
MWIFLPLIFKEGWKCLQYSLLVAIIFILPYWGLFPLYKHLVIALFIISLFFVTKKEVINLFSNRLVITLFAFIIVTFLSAFWSESQVVFSVEYKLNFNRFKYYFLLIPAIYFTPFSLRQIKEFFLLMALAPLGTIIIYFLNVFFDFNSYPVLFFHGNSKLLTHYLINNFFILYGLSYFYLLMFDKLSQEKYKNALLLFGMVCIYFTALWIDKASSSRLILVVFTIIATVIPFFYLKKGKFLLSLGLVIIMTVGLFIVSPKMIKGIETFTTALKSEHYEGSWGHRYGFLLVGADIYMEHPCFGRGISDVRERTIRYAKEHPKYFVNDPNRHFHNEHLNVLVEVGIFGYILFLLSIFYLWKMSLRERFIENLKKIFIILFLLIMMGEHYLSIYQTTNFFALFVGLVLLYEKNLKDNHTSFA